MGDGSSDAPKKMKFIPKIRPRKVLKPVQAKTEAPDDDAAVNEELLRRVKENFGRTGPKVEKKLAAEQIASFGPSSVTTFPRTFGNPGSTGNSSSATRHQGPVTGDGGNASSMPRTEKEYVEEWDYYSYYPTVLPLRRPHSGNPEILNELEFGEASNLAYDESRINAAEELGLMEDDGTDTKMLFFQLPASLPLVKRSASAKGKEVVDGSKPPPKRAVPEKACRLEELPAGLMGKMLVYKSGAIKMKLGDTLFDVIIRPCEFKEIRVDSKFQSGNEKVSPGVDCSFAQEVAVINPVEKHCCMLGELNKRAIVTPDVDALLDGLSSNSD